MKIGIGITPLADWDLVRAGALAADRGGLDAIFLWDHYHSAKPEWGYVSGWSALGALAALTERVRIVPMVLNAPHYQLGVLAKESSVIANLSRGRFELGIGAGDWPDSFAAWGERFEPAVERIERLRELVVALKQLWTGQPVTWRSRHVALADAVSSPPPPGTPSVVIGAGKSHRTIAVAAEIADQINVYPEPDAIELARRAIERSGRSVSLSIHADWSWTSWPGDPAVELDRWRDAGVDRALVACGSTDIERRVETLAAIVAA